MKEEISEKRGPEKPICFKSWKEFRNIIKFGKPRISKKRHRKHE